MSFWTKCGVTINDLECFRQSCRQNGVEYIVNEDPNFKMQGGEVVAILRDTQRGAGYAREGYLIRSEGAHKVVLDNDPNYSSLTRRLGRNGGKLTRGYTEGVITKGVKRNNAFISSREEQPDGSIVMKIQKVA
jgi:hypothetical protein